LTATSTGRGCISIGVPSFARIFVAGMRSTDPSINVTQPV